ncbi:MAG: hypothetical protein WA919_22760 [Coleofasciculaceae cyanobacterium]
MTATIDSLLEKKEDLPETATTPKAPENNKIQETTKTAKTAKAPDTTTTTKTTKTPENNRIQETTKTAKTTKAPDTATTTKTAKKTKTGETKDGLSVSTLEMAAQDVRMVMTQQNDQGQTMTTKLNILFVTNGALLTSLTISRLLFFPSPFSLAEMLGFLTNFSLLINAFLPRQLAVSPNLADKKFLERYLVLSPEEYQLRMLVNLVEAYNANKQRLEDVSSSLKYAAYVTWVLVLIITLHVLVTYLIPAIDLSSFG